MEQRNFCGSCGRSNLHHIDTWMGELARHMRLPFRLSSRLEPAGNLLLQAIFIFLGLARYRQDFTAADIPLRSFVFLEEMKKRGAVCSVLHSSIGGFTDHIKVEIGGRAFRFEGLPLAEFMSRYDSRIVDDKIHAKRHCQAANFPVAAGRSFWFWQKSRAAAFAAQLGFPLVVKPRAGSLSRHVTTDIQDVPRLLAAIGHAIKYSPPFIVERYIPDASVVRATVIDFDFVFCVEQVPAHVVGDGETPISDLILRKNREPNRGLPHQKQFTLFRIVQNETTDDMLAGTGYTFASVPRLGETVFLQKDPFLKLGGDLVEVSAGVHKDNLKLFRDLARHFDIRLTGIDFLIKDISKSWKEQTSAVLELNSLPSIELHHFPSAGKATNPARALADMFIKYYVKDAAGI
ncbi:MAG: glutamate--cysteine ligase [Candidatus Parcubacteria bacterium]|jgi:D-alanine-D-alanine ligase-like ATP-grasp enzyme|nr:glutamate--cysteine ligase [Candidatus Parcubacteria bacterium]